MGLVARGIWWRRWASLVLLACAAVTVAGATAGPLWGRASQASLLARTLHDATVSERAWTATGSTDGYDGLTYPPPGPRQVEYDVRTKSALPPELDQLFEPVTTEVTTARELQIVAGKVKPVLGALVGRAGFCAEITVVAGACPKARTDVMLSDRSARVLRVKPGALLQLPELTGEKPQKGDPGVALYTVSGVYRAADVDTASRFWFDSDQFEFAPETSLGGETLPARLDAVLAEPDLVYSLRTFAVKVELERTLRPGAVTLANADRVAAQLDTQARDISATTRVVRVTASAADTIAATARGRELVSGTARFVGLQVVILGWVVLFGLVAVSVASRDAELALAKLRGFRGAKLVAHALAEPVTLVVLAVPLGLSAGWSAVRAAAGHVLLKGTTLQAESDLWWTLGATVAGSVVACALAVRRSVRVPVADQLRRQTPQAGTAGPVAAAVLLTLAVVGMVLVLTLGRGAQAALPALLTPVVAGLAAGLVVGQAVRLLLRALVDRTHRWPLGPYLAVRQLARSPSMTHVTALVTVATTVSGFAAAAYVVTANQRAAQARFDVGAERVVHVARTSSTDLLAATRTADPAGAWAMAAVQRGTGTSTILAVDTKRYRGFVVPDGLDRLVPTTIPQPLEVKGPSATITVAAYLYSSSVKQFGIQLRVVKPDGSLDTSTLGTLDPQGRPRTLTGPISCPTGCTVAGVYLTRQTGLGPVDGTLELKSLEIGGKTYPFTESEWRPARVDESVPDSTTTSTLRAGEPGVEVRFDAQSSVTPGIIRRDRPTELPAVVADQTDLSSVGTRDLVQGSTLEGGDLPFEVVGRSPVIPRARGGSMVDLELASRVEPPRAPDLDFQVWLGRAAPPDATRRLEAAGLNILDTDSRRERQAELDRAEPARAQLLLLAAGAAVLLAGVAGIATALGAAARRRAVESAALHAMAVPHRVVRGSAVLEDVLLLLPGLVTGAVAAGVLATTLTPVLAEITGAAAATTNSTGAAEIALVVTVAAAATAALLVPVVLAVTRPAAAETPLRSAT